MSVTDLAAEPDAEGASRDVLRAVVELSPDGMLVVDGTGTILQANRQLERLAGCGEGGLDGRPVEWLVPGPLRHRHAGLRSGFLAAPRTRQMSAGQELSLLRADGTLVPVDIALAWLRDTRGGVTVAAVRDATERVEQQRRIETARRRDQALAQALGRVTTTVLGTGTDAGVVRLAGELAACFRARAGAVLADGPDGVRVLGASGVEVTAGEHVRALGLDEERVRSVGDQGPVVVRGAMRSGRGRAAAVGLVVVPIGEAFPGWLVLLGAPHLPAADLEALAAAVAQAGVALALGRAQEENRRLAVVAERQRLARDLHDGAVQDVIGAGLQLNRLSRAADLDPAHEQVVEQVLARLDGVVRALRHDVLRLATQGRPEATSLVRRIVADATPALGFPAHLQVRGDLDGLDAAVVGDLAAVLREALSNVARHARARDVQVDVEHDGHRLLLSVADDGQGAAGGVPGEGLRSMAHRARALGGSVSVLERAPRGTRVLWEVPSGGTPA